jgi:hypothetical protein
LDVGLAGLVLVPSRARSKRSASASLVAVQPLLDEGIAAALVIATFGHIVPSEAESENASPSPVRRCFGLFIGRAKHIKEIRLIAGQLPVKLKFRRRSPI